MGDAARRPAIGPILREGARTFGLTLTPGHIAQFEQYAAELIAWNRRVNLTSIAEPLDIARKHYLDSLSVLGACQMPHAAGLIDVGSGAGFPGLPLRIVRPDLHVALLEATRKKCVFLRHVVSRLELDGVAIVHARAESAARDGAHRERYDVAVARGVAELDTLAEYVLPLVRVGGFAVAQKSGAVEVEVEKARPAVERLGGRLRRIVPVAVPGIDEPRCVVLLDKIAPTPDRYPRRAGMPGKRPIR